MKTLQEPRLSFNMDSATGPLVIQQILNLHEDSPDVVRKVKAAFDVLYTRKPSTETPKALYLQSLLTILEHCGDFQIQSGVVQLIIVHDDVKEYKEWFAKQWFEGMPATINEFINLVSGFSGEGRVKAQDIRNFLMGFNMEKPLQYVVSVLANNVSWNKVPLRQSCKSTILTHLNSGTLTLSITGIECRLPKELDTRGSLFMKSGEVHSAKVYTLVCPYGTKMYMFSIKSAVGHLIFHVDPLLSNEQWQQIQEFFQYIFKVGLEFVDRPEVLQRHQTVDNAVQVHTLQPENENQTSGFNVQLPQKEPAKSLVSSSSQDNFSVNCLALKLLPNQEDIQMCDQFAEQSAASESLKETNQLPSCNSLMQVTEDLRGNNDIVGSTCDDPKKKKAVKRRSSICNKESSKSKPHSDIESDNEVKLSSTKIEPNRRETRSLSRSKGQITADDFKEPRQLRRVGNRGRGRGGASNNQATIKISDCSKSDDVSVLHESASSPLKEERTLEIKVSLDPIEPSTDNCVASSLMMDVSPPEIGTKNLPSMPTLDTPYSTPQHEYSNQAELKMISINNDNESQSILKSHEILLTQLEECEALRAGPPPAIPLYAPSYFNTDSLPNDPQQLVQNCSPSRLDAEPNRLESDLQSAQPAVLLPIQFATDKNPTAECETEEMSVTHCDMDPLKIDNGSELI